MTVARVVTRGEMFDDCGCANKWEWVSVNGSRINLVGRRREKPVGHSKLCSYVRFKKNERRKRKEKKREKTAEPQTDIIFFMMDGDTLTEDEY